MDNNNQLPKISLEEMQRLIHVMQFFLKGVAHDIRNPLGGASGKLQFLLDHEISQLDNADLDAGSKLVVEHIKDTIRKAVIPALQEVDRNVSVAVMQFFPSHFDLSVEVAKKLRMFQSKLEGIKVTKNLNVHADVAFPPDSLERILGNMIDNIIEATARQNIQEPWMRFTTEVNEKKHVCFIIENSGKIDLPVENVKDSIFAVGVSSKELSLGNDTGVDSNKQHGWGLAYVKWLIELFRGSIKLDSEEDPVRFIITLPITPAIIQ